MAAVGYLESLLQSLPQEIKGPLIQFTREGFKTLRIGPPGSSAVAAENFGAHLVPFTTHGTANTEVAVAHGLPRAPTTILTGVLPAGTVNATNPVIAISRAADATYVYIKSATENASGWLYVEMLVMAVGLSSACF